MNELRDNRRKKFFMVDNDVIDTYGDKIGVYGFAVYSLLLRYAGQGDTAFPSYQTIGKKFGFSERQAIRTIALLVNIGLIEKQVRHDQNKATTSNIYTLIDVPSCDSQTRQTMTHSHPPYDSQSPPPMTQSHPPYDTESYNKDTVEKTQNKEDDDDPPIEQTTTSIEQNSRRRQQPFSEKPADPAYTEVKTRLQKAQFGRMDGETEKLLKGLWAKYDHAGFDQAIAACLKANRPTLGYLEGVLKNFSVEGVGGWKANGSKPPGQRIHEPEVPDYILKMQQGISK